MIELQTAWGWQVGLYLFLGGLGAGTFAAATVLSLVRRKRHRRALAVSYWVAVACIAVGLLSLLAEVVRPDRALLVWQSFSRPASWMALGAWGALAALVVFSITAFLATGKTSEVLSEVWEGHPGLRKRLRTAFSLVGLAPALFVALYTGMLLKEAQGVPFWDSWLLPCLFLASALGAGVNAVSAFAVITGSAEKGSRRRRRLFAGIVIGAVTVEGALLFVYVATMLQGGSGALTAQQFAARASAELLLFGSCSAPFWGLVVAGGLVAPLALSVSSFFLKSSAGWKLLALGALLTVAGDCTLRFLVLHVGMGADYLGQALLSIM
ncbi:NrfD/PsrC family molybdoenzyme membrane anchor subunit [Raoultibacter phocaeensis]|uniref:NrfD/PsrC family molybdoenzyme membrane anchor subunit n=1 Tax=Raoultibacter phocaeensis TaxID=2479841 RepID=UPI001119AC5B|nr:NrfD/PsrC family molybdoenzyme membrane anchor subunit [Raoultibacter phocaeensis]